MTSSFNKIVELKIREAMAKGEFDDLPGKGKPLEDSDWEKTPEEMRLAFKILKNAGYIPLEIELKNEISKIKDTLKSTTDKEEKHRLIKERNYLQTKLSLMLSTSR